MNTPENPRAVAGDNRAQSAAENVTNYLIRDYASFTADVAELLGQAAEVIARPVLSDEDAIECGKLIKLLREADARAEAYRETEKAPHRLSADAVDGFFFPIRESMAAIRSRKTNRPGAIDRLQGGIDSYQDAKRQAEEQRRREEARIALAEANRKAAEEVAAQQAETNARRAALRARNPENAAARASEAEAAAAKAAQAAAEADAAKLKAQDAQVAALAKPADLVRTRGEGVTLTQRQEGYCVLKDRRAITAQTWAALGNHFTPAEIEKAGRGLAKALGHAPGSIPGFEVGMRPVGVTR